MKYHQDANNAFPLSNSCMLHDESSETSKKDDSFSPRIASYHQIDSFSPVMIVAL
jgi:hypothetical protein